MEGTLKVEDGRNIESRGWKEHCKERMEGTILMGHSGDFSLHFHIHHFP